MSKNKKPNRWREMSGALSIIYRLNPGGQLELQGRLQSLSQIQKFCQQLEQELIREWQLNAALQNRNSRPAEMSHQRTLFQTGGPEFNADKARPGSKPTRALELSRIPELKPDRKRRKEKRRAG